MSFIWQCEADFFDSLKASLLWRDTCAKAEYAGENDEVVVRCVDEAEMVRLNRTYRGKPQATNVLTFSYDGEVRTHDIVLCEAVARREAKERGVSLSDYTALLLVHAFLHACGWDHELSETDARRTQEAEQAILAKHGFRGDTL